MPGDRDLLRERVVKEVLHELGHTFGLTHCAESKCVMSLATHIELVDSKSRRLLRPVRRAPGASGLPPDGGNA